LPSPQPPSQVCVALLQARPAGQSAATLQPQLPPTHAWPAPALVQSRHTPLAPHAPTATPLTHVPPEQQPPLHGCDAEQAGVQVCVPAEQACPLGQSDGPLHPHALATHACPAAALVQSTQLAPVGPHAVGAVPGWQPPLWQQPLAHATVAEHAANTQTCVAGLQLPAGQSALELHPHAPARQAVPIELPTQLTQAPPVVPHAALLAPAAQIPDAQQPPWQGCAALHRLVQACLTASQAKPVGQSFAELQPQEPPLALGRHSAPMALPTHEAHAPDEPHAPAVVPAAHRPPEQQPPLQGCDAEQLVVQLCVLTLQAWPLGQSAGPLQPHAPATHAWPAAALVQSVQLPPDGPHAVVVFPGRQPPL
jgi:hypothetical protein